MPWLTDFPWDFSNSRCNKSFGFDRFAFSNWWKHTLNFGGKVSGKKRDCLRWLGLHFTSDIFLHTLQKINLFCHDSWTSKKHSSPPLPPISRPYLALNLVVFIKNQIKIDFERLDIALYSFIIKPKLTVYIRSFHNTWYMYCNPV